MCIAQMRPVATYVTCSMGLCVSVCVFVCLCVCLSECWSHWHAV